MTFNSAFEQLLAAWRESDELRNSGAGFDQRLDAKARLEAARHAVRQTHSI